MNSIIVIAASAGGLAPLKQVVSALPAGCTASVFVVLHIGARPSLLPKILSGLTMLPVSHAVDAEVVEPGHIYVAPPDHHMRLKQGRIYLDRGPKVRFSRPAADPLFVSAADAYGDRVVGIVLSGYDGDGAEGLRVVKERGGLALVQDPGEAEQPGMPWSAIYADHPDAHLPAQAIAKRVAEFSCNG